MAAMGRSRRGFTQANQQQERVRTHLFFSSQPEHQQQKRKRRPTNKLHQMHRKDEMVQTGPVELDPASWTGNQRVLHFGPMAQRNPFFYYYPKGWDILYPAHFGFFPYRTSKFRGSSPIICLAAFGAFFLLGGALMSYLGFYVLHDSAFWNWPSDQRKFLPPIQLAGPAFLAIGALFVFLGFCWWISTLHLLRESLRYSQYHHGPPKRTVRTYQQRETTPRRQPPYQPLPPPAYPILANAYTEPTV
uniref:Uncharacterized protein n=1 Tax=Plectus sambesii TaxID=2011161 RepID=A0A914WJ95_9BILA